MPQGNGGARGRSGSGGSPRHDDLEDLLRRSQDKLRQVMVFWRIKDATKYFFNIQKPEVTVKEVAESAMRDIVGQSNSSLERGKRRNRPCRS